MRNMTSSFCVLFNFLCASDVELLISRLSELIFSVDVSARKCLMFSLWLLFNAALLLRLSISNLLREGILMPHLLNGDISHSATQALIGASIHKRILFMHRGSSVSETHVAVKLHILKEEEIRDTINR